MKAKNSQHALGMQLTGRWVVEGNRAQMRTVGICDARKEGGRGFSDGTSARGGRMVDRYRELIERAKGTGTETGMNSTARREGPRD